MPCAGLTRPPAFAGASFAGAGFAALNDGLEDRFLHKLESRNPWPGRSPSARLQVLQLGFDGVVDDGEEVAVGG
jgi:hypothetical protein